MRSGAPSCASRHDRTVRPAGNLNRDHASPLRQLATWGSFLPYAIEGCRPADPFRQHARR
jgi:hypothetical protein